MAMAGTSSPADLVRGLSALAAPDDYVLVLRGFRAENFWRPKSDDRAFVLSSFCLRIFMENIIWEVIRLRHFLKWVKSHFSAVWRTCLARPGLRLRFL